MNCVAPLVTDASEDSNARPLMLRNRLFLKPGPHEGPQVREAKRW